MSTAGLMGRQMRHRKERSKSKRKGAEEREAAAAIASQQLQLHTAQTQKATAAGLPAPPPLSPPKPKRRVHHTKQGSLRNHRTQVSPQLLSAMRITGDADEAGLTEWTVTCPPL